MSYLDHEEGQSGWEAWAEDVEEELRRCNQERLQFAARTRQLEEEIALLRSQLKQTPRPEPCWPAVSGEADAAAGFAPAAPAGQRCAGAAAPAAAATPPASGRWPWPTAASPQPDLEPATVRRLDLEAPPGGLLFTPPPPGPSSGPCAGGAALAGAPWAAAPSAAAAAAELRATRYRLSQGFRAAALRGAAGCCGGGRARRSLSAEPPGWLCATDVAVPDDDSDWEDAAPSPFGRGCGAAAEARHTPSTTPGSASSDGAKQRLLARVSPSSKPIHGRACAAAQARGAAGPPAPSTLRDGAGAPALRAAPPRGSSQRSKSLR